jgi:hypothetical protein
MTRTSGTKNANRPIRRPKSAVNANPMIGSAGMSGMSCSFMPGRAYCLIASYSSTSGVRLFR